jgi:hypothetical protein
VDFRLTARESSDGRTRHFSPSDDARSEVADFVSAFVTAHGLDGPVSQAAAQAAVHAFSLFAQLGMEKVQIRVSGRMR